MNQQPTQSPRRQSDAVRQLIESLGNADEAARRVERERLVKIGAELVPVLIEVLQCDNEQARWEAGLTIADIGPDAVGAVPALAAIVRRGMQEIDEFPMAGMALKALGAIGPGAADHLDDIIRCLGHPLEWVHRSAARALGEIGDLKAIHWLELARDTEPPPLSEDAAAALAKVEQQLPEQIAELIDEFRSDTDDDERKEAASLRLAYAGRRAIPALIDALRDANEDVRYFAAETLACIEPEEMQSAIPVLIETLNDKDDGVRLMSAQALEAAGKLASPAVPALIYALGDPDELVRARVVKALAEIGDQRAISALESVCDEPDPNVRRAIAEALEALRRPGD